jgi:hypothetical protein
VRLAKCPAKCLCKPEHHFENLHILRLGGNEIDYVGIVLRDKEVGVPYVFEHGLDGLLLIAFDTRLLFTRDTDVLIRVTQRRSLNPRENTTSAGTRTRTRNSSGRLRHPANRDPLRYSR